MNVELFACLKQERSIFEVFSSSMRIGKFDVYHSPSLEEIAHWNLVYPTDISTLAPDAPDFDEIKRHYEKIGVSGNLASTARKYREAAAEESEYFVLDGSPRLESSWEVNTFTHRENTLSEFCSLIQRCFSLSDDTISYFEKKMALLSVRPGTKFYIVEMDQAVIGCCSTFRTECGADFLFNVATLPEAEGKGVARSIIAYAALSSSRPLFTYSHSDKMRDSILPAIGFRSLGTLYCVPLSKVEVE